MAGENLWSEKNSMFSLCFLSFKFSMSLSTWSSGLSLLLVLRHCFGSRKVSVVRKTLYVPFNSNAVFTCDQTHALHFFFLAEQKPMQWENSLYFIWFKFITRARWKVLGLAYIKLGTSGRWVGTRHSSVSFLGRTFKYYVFAPMGKFQLELNYLYFPPSSHLIYVCFCPVGLLL